MDEAAGLGHRERKKRDTRNALSAAAARLAVEQGFDAVRVEDIAAEVGVSPRTFNNYFSGKGEAIAARHLERVRAIAEELRVRPASEPLWEAAESAVTARFGLGSDPAEAEPVRRQWTKGVRLMIEEPAVQAEFIRASAGSSWWSARWPSLG